MFKLYCFLQLRPGAPATAVPHDPFGGTQALGTGLLQELCPAATGYVRSRALPQQLTDTPAEFSGCAELYFDSVSALLDAWQQSAALAPLWSDAHQLIATVAGWHRVVMRLPEHHGAQGIKAIFPFRRRTLLTVAEFQHYWWHQHGPIAARTQDALYYVQCHPLPKCYELDTPPFDGVTELHWHNYQAAAEAMGSAQMRQDQANDAPNFAAPDGVKTLLAREEPVLAP